MSTALAIAGVSAVLRDLLNDGLIQHNAVGVLGSSVTVSGGPADRVVPADGSEASQLNLFLYQVTPNAAWRNEGLPARDNTGRQRLANLAGAAKDTPDDMHHRRRQDHASPLDQRRLQGRCQEHSYRWGQYCGQGDQGPSDGAVCRCVSGV